MARLDRWPHAQDKSKSAAQSRARRLLLCRRQADARSTARPHRRPDVCRIPHPGEADASLSDHHGARRHALGHELDRHARRPRRLGAVFRAPRLRGLRRRPARPRTFRPMCRRSTARRGSPTPKARSSAICSRRSTSCGRRRSCTAVARLRRDRRSGLAADHRQLPAGDRVPEIGRDHARRDGAAARPDRTVDRAGAFAGRPDGLVAADARPDLVRAIVAVEPNGPPGRTRALRRRAGVVQGRAASSCPTA